MTNHNYDINHDHEANYGKMLKWLDLVEKNSTTDTLNGLVATARRRAMLCQLEWGTSVESMAVFIEKYQKLSQRWDTESKNLVEIVKAQAERLASIEDPVARKHQTVLGERTAKLVLETLDLQNENATELHEYMLRVSGALHVTFFSELCNPDRASLAASIITNAAEFLVGLSPAGPWVDGIQRIRNIVREEESKIKTTDELLGSLERWNNGALYWTVMARYLTHNLANFDRPSDLINVDQAIERILDDRIGTDR